MERTGIFVNYMEVIRHVLGVYKKFRGEEEF